jgi:hypothetical protein
MMLVQTVEILSGITNKEEGYCPPAALVIVQRWAEESFVVYRKFPEPPRISG